MEESRTEREKGKERIVLSRRRFFFLSLSLSSLPYVCYVRWELTHIAHGGWLPSLFSSNTTALPLSLWWSETRERERERVEAAMKCFSYSTLSSPSSSFFSLSLSLPLYFVDVFFDSHEDTLTIRWKDVIVLLLAMVVDMVSQPQLTEVFTTNHSHHRSSSTHRRNSSTINQSSTSTSSDHATMTNGQRVLVSRDDTRAKQIEPSSSLSI